MVAGGREPAGGLLSLDWSGLSGLSLTRTSAAWARPGAVPDAELYVHILGQAESARWRFRPPVSAG